MYTVITPRKEYLNMTLLEAMQTLSEVKTVGSIHNDKGDPAVWEKWKVETPEGKYFEYVKYKYGEEEDSRIDEEMFVSIIHEMIERN